MGKFTWKSRRNGGQTAHCPCYDRGFPHGCAFAILTTTSAMNDNSTAEQNLDVIRGLIERGEIYRAVSARTALIGGVLSILTAGAIYLNDEVTRIWDRPVRPRELAFAWLGVLLLTVTVSVLFLSRSARKSGGVVNSSQMKLALRTIAPYLVIPAAFTGWFLTTGYLG